MKNKIAWRHRTDDEFFDPDEPVKRCATKKDPDRLFRMNTGNDRVMFDQYSFKCLQCNTFVNADRYYSGVNNRNHCPICLWSRHMDLRIPGDRRSNCRSRMKPIGLTFKICSKRYNKTGAGELLVIHHCTGCGKFSINRIAADDDPQVLFNIFLESWKTDNLLRNQIIGSGIFLLDKNDQPAVETQLFGCGKRWNLCSN